MKEAHEPTWELQDDEPMQCCGDGCNEDMNGLWFGRIKIGQAHFWINACPSCKKKAGLCIDCGGKKSKHDCGICKKCVKKLFRETKKKMKKE